MGNKARIFIIIGTIIIVGAVGGIKWKKGRESAELAAKYQEMLAAEEARQADGGVEEVSVWQVYTDPDNMFSVSFPGRLNQISEDVLEASENTPVEVMYQYEVAVPNGGVYFVHKGEYTTKFDLSAGVAELKKTLNTFVTRSGGGKLIDASPSTFAGKPAVDFTIQNGSTFIKGSTFFSNNDLYRVGIMYDILEYSREYEDIFLNSFTLLP